MKRRTNQGLRERQAELKQRLSLLGNQWAPTHDRLLGTPAPLPAEAFSSWCWRIAAHFCIPIRAVLKHFSIAAPSFWVDSGHIVPDTHAIASVAMTPVETLVDLEWAPRSILAKNEFACLTTDPLSRRPIYRYCRSCLNQDRIPYFRRLWRLGCAYVCPIHGEVLRDRCPRCHAPIDLSQDGLKGIRRARMCGRCGGDLCQGNQVHLPEEIYCTLLAHQAEALHQIAGSYPFPSEGYWHEKDRPFRYVRNHRTGEIDPSFRQNVLHMLQQLMVAYLEVHDESSTQSQYIQEIVKKLLVWKLDRGKHPPAALAIGFDGQSIFGHVAKVVSAYLKTSQSLSSGTYWWPLDRGTPFEKRRQFDEDRFWSAVGWIEAHSPSHTSKRRPGRPPKEK